MLGAADGMSPDDTTAGFVLWMRGRGILVDPARALGLTRTLTLTLTLTLT